MTKSEIIKLQREAYTKGWDDRDYTNSWTKLDVERKYPMLKKTIARILNDGQYQTDWKIEDGLLYFRRPWEDWYKSVYYGAVMEITPERVKIWADLFNNPTEEIDDD